MGATQAGFDADMGKYNADQAGAYAKKGSMGQMGASGIGAIPWSDERLKDNIEKIGEFEGHNIYSWDWNDMGKMLGASLNPNVGFIAQEVAEIEPEAVHEIGGFLAVDYSMILGEIS